MPAASDARDLIHICQHCGIRFVVTVAQQRDAVGDPRHGFVCPACRVLTPAAGRERGMVKWYNVRKGYGFISRGRGGDLFVHRSALPAAVTELRVDDLVEFEVEVSAKGFQAGDVVILATSASS